jgi:peroxiredoxin Q/BCP
MVRTRSSKTDTSSISAKVTKPAISKKVKKASEKISDAIKEEIPITKKSTKGPDQEVLGSIESETGKTEEIEASKVAKDAKNLTELQIGDSIPDITLLNQDEESLSLKELAKENKIVLIFAYPKANTPGCTRQSCGFRDNYDQVSKDALVLGLSADTPQAQNKFKTKFNFQYDLLSDPKRELITVLGAKKSPTGIIRSHWIFHNGKLVEKRIKISPEASVSEGKAKVLELAAAE